MSIFVQEDEETIKVTFTYYGANPQKLSDTITQDGIKASTEDILQQNQNYQQQQQQQMASKEDHIDLPDESVPEAIPAWIAPDVAPVLPEGGRPSPTKHVGFIDCDAFPTQVTQPQHVGDQEDYILPPTPINPPNSPSQLTLRDKNAGTLLRDDFDATTPSQDLWVRPHTTPATNEMPLILQARYLRLGGTAKGNGISVVGHAVNEGMTSTGYPKTPSNYVSGVKGGPRSARKAFRGKRRHQPPNLPKVSTLDVPPGKCVNPVNTALQMRLIEKNRLHESDKPKQRMFTPSPRLEFINVINPLAPALASSSSKQSSPSPQTPRPFDTDKLRINYSLEEVRPELVRSPTSSRRSKELRLTECGGGTAGKDYLLQKYICEANARPISPSDIYRPGFPEGVRKSAPLASGGHKQSTQPTETTVDLVIGNGKNTTSGDYTSTSPPISPSSAVQYQFFKQRTPGNFRHRCLKACDEFVVRKEQITSSRLYSTVTSITVNRVPTGGFGQWKFIDVGQNV